MCFHIKSDGWQCFHYVSSSSPQSDFRGQRWLDHLQLSTQWAIVGRSSRKLDLSERSSWGRIKAFAEYDYLSFWEDLFISANFSLSRREFMGRRCPYRPRDQLKRSLSEDKHGATSSRMSIHIFEGVCVHCVMQQRRCAGGSPDLSYVRYAQTKQGGLKRQRPHAKDSHLKRRGAERWEGRPRFQHHFSNLASDWGHERRFLRVKKSATISRGNHEVVVCWVRGWAVCFPCLIDFGENVY